MKKIKIILGILVVLFVLFVVAILIVGAHLGDIVKAGMEVAGPKVTQTTLTLDAVNISLLGGSAGVKNLVLGNPDGYKAPQSLVLSNAAVSLVPGSVLSDKIVIHSVEVRGLEVTFEGNPIGDNNLTKIMANVDSFTGSGSTVTGTNAPTTAPTQPAAQPAGATKPAKTLEVDDLVISGVMVHASLTGLVTKDVTLPIPDIHLSGLGTGPEGITPADLTKKVLSQITADTIKTLISSASALGKDLTDEAKKTAQGAVNGVLQNAGGAGSNTVDQVKKGLGGLFGK
jgi:hypothetical protein